MIPVFALLVSSNDSLGQPQLHSAHLALRSVTQKFDRHVKTDIFRQVRQSLAEETKVPLRLPTYIPDAGDKEYPLFIQLQHVSENGYEIQLAWTEDCEGGNACHYGTVQGSSSPVPENETKKIPVALARGIKGQFTEFTCGAHCDDSSISWNENGYYYYLSIKAMDLKTLVKVANSAILSKPDIRSRQNR